LADLSAIPVYGDIGMPQTKKYRFSGGFDGMPRNPLFSMVIDYYNIVISVFDTRTI
jgi:hypothetical protein